MQPGNLLPGFDRAALAKFTIPARVKKAAESAESQHAVSLTSSEYRAKSFSPPILKQPDLSSKKPDAKETRKPFVSKPGASKSVSSGQNSKVSKKFLAHETCEGRKLAHKASIALYQRLLPTSPGFKLSSVSAEFAGRSLRLPLPPRAKMISDSEKAASRSCDISRDRREPSSAGQTKKFQNSTSKKPKSASEKISSQPSLLANSAISEWVTGRPKTSFPSLNSKTPAKKPHTRPVVPRSIRPIRKEEKCLSANRFETSPKVSENSYEISEPDSDPLQEELDYLVLNRHKNPAALEEIIEDEREYEEAENTLTNTLLYKQNLQSGESVDRLSHPPPNETKENLASTKGSFVKNLGKFLPGLRDEN